MPTGRLEWTLFVAGVVALSALVIGIAWQERTGVNRPTDRASERAEPVTATVGTNAKKPSTKKAVAGAAKGAAVAKSETAAPGRKKQKTAANAARRKGRQGTPAPAPRPFFTFSAARGDSWLSIRVGSSAGKVLYEGLLQKGRTLRYRASTLWVRFGAATYVDVRLGKRKEFDLPFGTADVLLYRSGKSQLVALD